MLNSKWKTVTSINGDGWIDIPNNCEELHIRVIEANTRIMFVFHVVPSIDITPNYTHSLRAGYYLNTSVTARCIVVLDGSTNKMRMDSFEINGSDVRSTSVISVGKR